ncbi:MAG: DUF1559 domain-containing protein, partial [Gemmataceae bacterium]
MRKHHSRPGWTLIELVVVMAIVGVLVALLMTAVVQVRRKADQATCQNNLRQIGLGLHQYHTTHKKLPSACRTWNDTQPGMTWLTRLLPYFEQQAAWDEAVADYKLSFRFSDPANPHRNLNRVMPLFVCPADGRSQGVDDENHHCAYTHYLGVSGYRGSRDKSDGVLYYRSETR